MNKRFLIIILFCMVMRISNAQAGVSESMQSFWDGMGGVSNVSSADAYQLQSAGYYTLGGLHARTQVKNTQIASISLPSFKAGCGGINIHNGGFSFLNGEEIISLIKAIANNSTAFALQIGMETLSPVIAEKVEEMQSWAQRINMMNINSCELASTLVGGVWPRHERASQSICSSLANGNGVATDYVAARHGCNGNREGTLGKIRSHDSEASEKLLMEDVNIAWKALRDSGFMEIGKLFIDGKEQDGRDKSLAELFMTLSGTIIVHGSKSQSPGKFEYITGRATHNDLISTLLEGGEVKHHLCNDVDKCLNLVKEGTHSNISTEQAFKSKIENIILEIVSKIQSDTALTSEEKSFLNFKSKIPLYKILNVYAAYSGSGALFELPAYSEAIALQMLFEYLDDILRQVETASDSLIIADEDHIKRFRSNIRDARMALAQREIKTHQNFSTLMTLVDRAMVIEGILAKDLGSSLANAFHWSKNM